MVALATTFTQYEGRKESRKEGRKEGKKEGRKEDDRSVSADPAVSGGSGNGHVKMSGVVGAPRRRDAATEYGNAEFPEVHTTSLEVSDEPAVSGGSGNVT